jgi:hypothetical protein
MEIERVENPQISKEDYEQVIEKVSDQMPSYLDDQYSEGLAPSEAAYFITSEVATKEKDNIVQIIMREKPSFLLSGANRRRLGLLGMLVPPAFDVREIQLRLSDATNFSAILPPGAEKENLKRDVDLAVFKNEETLIYRIVRIR